MSVILHMSDFHLNEDFSFAVDALEALTDTLAKENIKVDYLVHTGDIIDSEDLYQKVCSQFADNKKFFYKDENGKPCFSIEKFNQVAETEQIKDFNEKVRELVKTRFSIAKDIMDSFILNLNIPHSNVVICCGNHDIVRSIGNSESNVQCTSDKGKLQPRRYTDAKEGEKVFKLFEEFLDQLKVANSKKRCGKEETIAYCELKDLNVLILNSNWINPLDKTSRYPCVRCDQVQSVIENIVDREKLNIIVAHKPIYEICETARLSYKRYIKTPFMAKLQEFINGNGIYLCGDKHTRSIVGSSFHDIPHYLCGEPLTNIETRQMLVSSTADEDTDFEVEYNLIEINGNKLERERKIHLKHNKGEEWTCDFHPPEAVISELYNISKQHIPFSTFEIIADPQTLYTWENLCQTIYGLSKDTRKQLFHNLDKFYRATCKYRECGMKDVPWEENENLFTIIYKRLKSISSKKKGNLLNIRGEYSSGKSTFLGLLYIYLLYKYSIGANTLVPVYFNLENDEIVEKIRNGNTYYSSAKQTFKNFTKEVQEKIKHERTPVCYIIDGLDEQDCWSYSSEDSVGRGVLDILESIDGVRYIIAYSQHRLPHFKNTMPIRKYNDISDVIYFNPVDVQEIGSDDKRFISFVDSFIRLKELWKSQKFENDGIEFSEDEAAQRLNEIDRVECEIIRKFRRLTVNPGFMEHNYKYISEKTEGNCNLRNISETIENVYKYYIDMQHELCMETLGYGFINYAPAMAFLFSYKGYTYEKFKKLFQLSSWEKKIEGKHDKIYDTFLFIKKQKDVREYLIALHYNRELRYYAENPNKEIEEGSILNEFITRNIAVQIRML